MLKRINNKLYLFIVAQNYQNAVISVTNCAVTCVPAPAPTVPPVITISCESFIVPGAAFSYTQSYTQADAVSTSAPTVGTVGNFSTQVSTAAGSKDTLAGTITSAGVMALTAGGAGTVATGQHVTELSIK